jgi:hypothetical protein
MEKEKRFMVTLTMIFLLFVLKRAIALYLRLRGMLQQLSDPRMRRPTMLWSAVGGSSRNFILLQCYIDEVRKTVRPF